MLKRDAIRKWARSLDPRDLLVFGGIALVALGLGWFVHPGLGFMAAGFGLFLIGTGIVEVK